MNACYVVRFLLGGVVKVTDFAHKRKICQGTVSIVIVAWVNCKLQPPIWTGMWNA